MDDLAGLGKAAEKFFALLEASVGTLYRPKSIRKEGEAAAEVEAYKVVALAKANAKADLIRLDAQQDLERRAINRLRQQELVKQTNIEAIAEAALDEVGASEINESADKDWLNYFFDGCASVSDSDVQKLWAKVLARQANLIRAMPIMTITKKTSGSMLVRRATKGSHVQQLHHTEVKFLDRLERILESNRRMICHHWKTK
jgi:hypothetical protein